MADLADGETGHQVRPDSNRLGDLNRRRLVQRRRDRIGDVAALGDDLVAAGAVLGEEMQAVGDVAFRRIGVRDGRPFPERADVRDQRPQLPLGEEDAAAARLAAGGAERHVAGAEIEVGGERTHPAQRRREARAGAVGTVAGDAVLAVQPLPLPNERAGGCLRRAGEGRGDAQGESAATPHEPAHPTSTTDAIPPSRTIARKMRFVAIAATAMSRSRPTGGGLR